MPAHSIVVVDAIRATAAVLVAAAQQVCLHEKHFSSPL